MKILDIINLKLIKLPSLIKLSIYIITFSCLTIPFGFYFISNYGSTRFFESFGVVIGAFLAFLFNYLLKGISKDEQISSIIQDIYTELKVLKENLFNDIEKKLFEENKEYFEYKCEYNQEYFAIFHSNSEFLGNIPSKQIRNSIVEIYTIGKSLLDSIILNNNLLDVYLDANARIEKAKYIPDDHSLFYKELRKDYLNKLINQKSNNLIPKYNNLKEKIDNLLYLLEKNGLS